ncbi:hypothetical protein GCM10017687_75500 [Streptomyces echinatus]
MVTTSIEPNTAPVAVKQTSSAGTPGLRSGDGAFERARGGGSVARWAVNSAIPASSSTAPTSVPASGKNVPVRKDASTGPSMKHSSSAACSKAFAACSVPGSSRSRWAQRARDRPPMLGVAAVQA